MLSNRSSNDIDLVQPTQYNVQPNRVAITHHQSRGRCPILHLFKLDDFDDHGTPNLSPDLYRLRDHLRDTTND